MTLMPRERTWERDGVSITFLTYETMASLKTQSTMRKAYGFKQPTASDPDATGIAADVYSFYKAMPAILSVSLADNAPLWGVMLKEEVERLTWLENPIEDYRRMVRLCPPDSIFNAYEGYEATREKVYAAPIELQTPLPPPPDDDEEDETGEKKESLSGAGRSSEKKPLIEPTTRSAAPRQTRKSTTSRRT